MTPVKFASDIEQIKQGVPVLVDGEHHGQRRYTRKLRSAVPGSVELHVDALTLVPVDIYDSKMNPAGTATIVYKPPMADPVAALVSAQARGRKYAIQALPSTPRNAPGGTQWTGNLVLEEYEYDANLADLTTEETY